MPEQPYGFLISVFSPVTQTSNEYQDFPLFSRVRTANSYYLAFDSTKKLLLNYLSKGVIVKVGITEASKKPRYIVFYASRKNNQLTIYTRKTDNSPFQVLDENNYRNYFRAGNAITFTKPVNPVKKLFS